MSKELFFQYKIIGYVNHEDFHDSNGHYSSEIRDSYIKKTTLYGKEIDTQYLSTVLSDLGDYQVISLVGMSFSHQNVDIQSSTAPIGFTWWSYRTLNVSDDFTIPDEYNNANIFAPFFDTPSADNSSIKSQKIIYDDSHGGYLANGSQYAKEIFIGHLEDAAFTVAENIVGKYGLGSMVDLTHNALTVHDVLKSNIDNGVTLFDKLLNHGDEMTPTEVDDAINEYVNGSMRTTLVGLNEIIGKPGSAKFDTIAKLGGDVLLATKLAGEWYHTYGTQQRVEFISFSGDKTTTAPATGHSLVILDGAFPSTNTLGSGNDIYYGGFGADSAKGGLGNDYINGGDSSDSLQGEAGDDYMVGGGGNDSLNGGTGADTLTGGDGNDTYYLDNSRDKAIETNASASQIDTVYSYLSSYTLGTNLENLHLLSTGNANATGNALNNTIYATTANNVINGNDGIDTVSYARGASKAVAINLSLVGGQATNGSGVDTLKNIENIIGSAYNDTLAGNAKNNVLTGGAGLDILTGGAGRDVFVLKDKSKDTIRDFSVTDDTIQLENSVLTKLFETGILKAAYLKIGATATDGNDYIIYNKATGALLYDDDGGGAQAAVQIAALGLNLPLTSADFVVI